jgi:NAD-dependent deacetylase
VSVTLSSMIGDAGRICVLTGAGISTESGIPDFRSPGGIWSKYRIIEYPEFIASEAARLEDWRRRFDMEERFGAARPSRGHTWVRDLMASSKCRSVVTQNIDGLHQQSGVPDTQVIELHGNARRASCIACGLGHAIEECRMMLESTGRAPQCRACDGIVKCDVVMFGELMPARAMERAAEAAENCDLFVAIGTSLVVYPAASLPVHAKRAGARLAIVNREQTELDSVADLVLHGEIGTLLAGPPDS